MSFLTTTRGGIARSALRARIIHTVNLVALHDTMHNTPEQFLNLRGVTIPKETPLPAINLVSLHDIMHKEIEQPLYLQGVVTPKDAPSPPAINIFSLHDIMHKEIEQPLYIRGVIIPKAIPTPPVKANTKVATPPTKKYSTKKTTAETAPAPTLIFPKDSKILKELQLALQKQPAQPLSIKSMRLPKPIPSIYTIMNTPLPPTSSILVTTIEEIKASLTFPKSSKILKELQMAIASTTLYPSVADTSKMLKKLCEGCGFKGCTCVGGQLS